MPGTLSSRRESQTTATYTDRLGQYCETWDFTRRVGHPDYEEGSASTSDYEIHGLSHEANDYFIYTPSDASEATQIQAAKDACNDNAACKMFLHVGGYFRFHEETCTPKEKSNWDMFDKGERRKAAWRVKLERRVLVAVLRLTLISPQVGNACTSDADCNEKCINSVCTVPAKCSTLTCPTGFQAKTEDNDCAAGTCTVEDTGTCCDPLPPAWTQLGDDIDGEAAGDRAGALLA